MEINKTDIKTEQLPESAKNEYIATIIREIEVDQNLSQEQLYEKLEIVLTERAKCTCKFPVKKSTTIRFICRCYSIENTFILGQFYFDAKKYKKAYEIFDRIKNENRPSLYQLGVILYDDLLDNEINKENHTKNNEHVDVCSAFHHPNKEKWVYGFELMLKLAESTNVPDHEKTIVHSAQFNVGKAYYQGFGVKQSDKETEKYWIKAADDGNPKGCVAAQTALAFFYSRKNDPEYYDLKKAFYWHNEACGNGSLESQGALGAMYFFGIGCTQNMSAAYECLTDSSERGNVYSMGLLCDYYYRNKFYAKAAELSKKVSALTDLDKISKETKCLKNFIAKGISLASFTQARCLELGKGTARDSELAKLFYKRSFYFDQDLCQLFQNYTTHQIV